jgi:outer membrane receptor protein involved in Fe transport
MNYKITDLSMIATAISAALSLPISAQAQTDSSTDKEVNTGFERVIVTATKRSEGLEEVPVSVSAVDANMMRDAGITDMAELSAYIPNFEVSDASILPNLYVRGIGSGTTHSIEQSVGRFIDEVYIGRAAINLHGMMDMEAVEVLRGPQGTLFGKNTLAGAMIMRTANPTEDFEVGINTSVSEYSTVGGVTSINGFVSGPLSDTLRARVSAQWKDKDGYIENLLDGPDGGTREDFGIRTKFEWDATEDTLVSLKLEHMEYEEEGQTPSVYVSVEGGLSDFDDIRASGGRGNLTLDTILANTTGFDFREDWISYINCAATLGPDDSTFCPGREQDSQNVTLKIDHKFDGAGTLTSVTGYQQYHYLHKFVAVDQGIIGGGLRAEREEDYDGISQELRFTSEEFDTYDYIVGVFYENSDLERLQPSDFNIPAVLGIPAGPPFFTEREDWSQSTETLALFGQYRWHLSEQFSAILGGRWSTEEKDFDLTFAETEYQGDPYALEPEVTIRPQDDTDINFAELANVDAYRYIDSRSESKFTPSFAVRYTPNNDLMVFASVAQGHKTGGFSDRSSQLLDGSLLNFEPELNTTFEVGIKGTFLDGTLQTNLSVFHMAIEDLQVARAIEGNGTAFEVKNAAEATSQGVEFDGRFLLSETLTLAGNYSYTDATYDDFVGASPSCPQVGGTVQADGLCNYAGLPLIYAPENKASVYLQYHNFTASDWEINARVGASYSDEYYYEINYFETLKNEANTLWDASIRITSPDERYSFALVGRNLTEEFVHAWGLQGGFTEYVAPNTPREIALQFSYKFVD